MNTLGKLIKIIRGRKGLNPDYTLYRCGRRQWQLISEINGEVVYWICRSKNGWYLVS